ncbi:PadR family transcriptional regulator [Micrococcaceae bacterium Sec5.7]
MLLSLLEGPQHGYAIASDIAERAGTRPGPGTLYGAISRLEQLGHITAVPGADRRRPYQITDSGVCAVRESIDQLGAIVAVGRERLKVVRS